MLSQTNKELFLLLDICCKLVAEQFGKPEFEFWTNRDYLFFSHSLFNKTSVQLSASTLKRLFGKVQTTERYYPQRATRDALAQYAGFKDWEDFANATTLETQTNTINQSDTPNANIKGVKNRRKWALIVTLVIMAVILSIFIAILMSPPTLPQGRLVCKNPEGKTPHSAMFTLQMENQSSFSEPFFVDFGDGETKKPIIAGSTLTHYYEIPGRYYPKLIYDGEVIDTTVVYLKTAGWTATATTPKDTTRVYPIQSFTVSDTVLEVSSSQIYRSGIDTNYTFFVDFVNTQPTNVSADNFELSVKLQTSPDRAGVRCSPLYMYIYGEKTSHYFSIHKSGCESWIGARFSEQTLDGGTNDMHELTADISQGGQIRLRVDNKKVSIFLDKRLLFALAYTKPVGKIYGMKLTFGGLGSITSVNLLDLISTNQVTMF